MTIKTSVPSKKSKGYEQKIREICLSFPQTQEDFPWGHSAFKIKKKAFVFMGLDDSGLSISMKLKESHAEALEHSFAKPTHYGLGKHGWVSAQFGPGESVPIEVLRAWIDESFRLIAPKAVLKELL
jgi:predicted DNA-binding protein (MmcQ/YjbR family)